MKKTLHLVYGTFKYSALSQLKKEETLMMGVAVGIIQGLKYTGSLKRGVTAGLTVMGAISAANGIHNILINMDKIKTYYEEEKRNG